MPSPTPCLSCACSPVQFAIGFGLPLFNFPHIPAQIRSLVQVLKHEFQPTYFGPDRRFKIESRPKGGGRRKGDGASEAALETGPAFAKNEIDNQFSATHQGKE
jgi:hypothetical protein